MSARPADDGTAGADRTSFELPEWFLSTVRPESEIRLALVESEGPNLYDLLSAVRLALEDAGETAHVHVFDDGRCPHRAERVARHIACHRFDCCIGHFGSRTAVPASRIYAEADLLFLAPGTSADALCSEQATTTAQFFGRDREQADCLAKAARAFPGGVLIVGQEGNYGADLAQALAGELQTTNTVTWTPTIDVLRSAEWPSAVPGEALFILGSKEFAATCLERLWSRVPQRPFFLSDDNFGTPFATCDSHRPAKGQVAFLAQRQDRLLDRRTEELAARSRALTDRPPGAYLFSSYLAVRAYLAARSRTAEHGAASILAAMREDCWQTPYGRLSLSERNRIVGHSWELTPVPPFH